MFIDRLARVALVGEPFEAVGQIVAIGDDHAAVTGGHMFAAKAKAAQVPPRTDGPPLIFGQLRLGAIFDQEDVVFARQFDKGGQVAGVAIEMHQYNRLGALGDFGRHIVDIQVAGDGVNVGKDRHGVLVENADDRAKVGDAGGDNFVAGVGVDHADGGVDGGGAGGDSLGILHPLFGSKIFLKLVDFCPAQAAQLAGADHLGQLLDLLVAQIPLRPKRAGANRWGVTFDCDCHNSSPM